MSIFHAIVLGITQGLSEYLPISSSGHLILVPWLFGWNDFADNDHLKKTFDVALHMGTLAGALAYFRADVMRYSRASLRMIRHRDEPTTDGRIGWMLLLGAMGSAIQAMGRPVDRTAPSSLPMWLLLGGLGATAATLLL